MVRGATRSSVERARELRRIRTAAEARLWDKLRNRQIAGLKFRRQVTLGPYIVDFCCPECRLVVELDGAVHESEEATAYDVARSEWLDAFGYCVLRFRNEELSEDLDDVMRRIADAAASRLT